MALSKEQAAALQNVYDHGILDHDDKAGQALAQVLEDNK